jgi:quinol monooxygenase YgiN
MHATVGAKISTEPAIRLRSPNFSERLLVTVVVVAVIHPLPEHRAEVISVFEGTIARVHAEDAGCELYAMHEDADTLVMIEKWSSGDALKAHAGGPALAEMNPKLEGKLAAKTQVKVYTPHPAGTPEQGTL